MKPTDDLFKLVKSLTSNEKRYFKLFALSIGGKENSAYMRLFNAIEEMDEYDEGVLKEKLKHEQFIKQLSVAKNYLYRIILKSLVQSNAESTISVKLALQVTEAEILLEKGLLEQCSKFIQLIKKDLKSVDDFHLLDRLRDVEGRIHIKRFEFDSFLDNDLEQLQELRKRKYVLEHRRKAVEIFSLNQHIANILTDKDKADLHAIVAPLFDYPPPKNVGVMGAFYYYTCLNFYYGALKDAAMRFHYAQKVMDLLHANPGFVEMNPRMYFSAASNLCQALLGISDFKKAEQFIQQMKTRNIQGSAGIKREIQNEVMAGVLNAEILLNINNKNFDKAVSLEGDVEKVIGKDKFKVGNFYFFELSFNLAHAHFMAGNPLRALDFLENILRDTNNEQRKDLHLVSRIFQLILHYETGAFKLLDNLAETTIRYLKRQQALTDFDKELINLLKKRAAHDANDWKDLHERITSVSGNRVSMLQGYIDVAGWIERRMV